MTLWKFLIGQKIKHQHSQQILKLALVREGKVITMGNVTDMEKFQEIMTSEKMKAWDTKHNCVDVVYSLEKQ